MSEETGQKTKCERTSEPPESANIPTARATTILWRAKDRSRQRDILTPLPQWCNTGGKRV